MSSIRQSLNHSPMLVTAGIAAEILAISPRKLWALTASGEIPCVRFGRSVRYAPDDLAAWIESRKVGANAPVLAI